MITSLKGAFIASVVAAFIAGALTASPELRAYAAATIGSADIINNSIQSVDIKDGEVKSADIGADAVQNGDIGNNVITSQKIKDGTLNKSDFAAGTLPTFGLTIRLVEESVVFTPNLIASITARCNEDETPVGGGFSIRNVPQTHGVISAAYLSPDPCPNNGFTVTGYNNHPLVTGTLVSIIHCARVSQ